MKTAMTMMIIGAAASAAMAEDDARERHAKADACPF